jgi:hypothetical protein
MWHATIIKVDYSFEEKYPVKPPKAWVAGREYNINFGDRNARGLAGGRVMHFGMIDNFNMVEADA